MKRNLFGIFAVVLAIAFSSFSSKSTILYFRYQAPGSNPYHEGSVETEGNWVKEDATLDCDIDQDQKACVIGVDDSFLENTTTYTNLDNADTNNDLFIDADAGTSSKVVDILQGSQTGTTIVPEKYNKLD